jgi:transcriptional regulator with XRE-family HTH domain
MPLHHEERRVAALLQEWIRQRGVSLDTVEVRAGWEKGKLMSLLEGKAGFSFTELLDVLQALDTTPSEFFAQLYGFAGVAAGGDALDRHFDESRRVVRNAVARRLAWKRDRADP